MPAPPDRGYCGNLPVYALRELGCTCTPITGGEVERVVRQTLEARLVDATHASTRSMAARHRPDAISHRPLLACVWTATALLSDVQAVDRYLFIDKVRDALGLHLARPEPVLVLSVDERTQVQALDRKAPDLALAPGEGLAPTWLDLAIRHFGCRYWHGNVRASLVLLG